jgi:hypothetical protein
MNTIGEKKKKKLMNLLLDPDLLCQEQWNCAIQTTRHQYKEVSKLVRMV